MKIKLPNIIVNASYSITSNLISFIVSLLTVVILPKVLEVEEYGYWQLYLFYTGYVGLLHFGWNDGFYLRVGGKDYHSLDKRLISSQFNSLFLFQIVLALVLFFVSSNYVHSLDRFHVLSATCIYLVIVNTRYFLLFLLQATNRFKTFAFITFIDRLSFVFLVVSIILTGHASFRLVIIADLLTKLLGLLVAIYFLRDTLIEYFCLKIYWREIYTNISVGVKLTFAVLASKFIVGVIRFAIERLWDIGTFGKVSLTLSISNMLMVFINAVGLVLFPTLRRVPEKDLSSIYSLLRGGLMLIMFALLCLYYPIIKVCNIWLPDYGDSLKYLAVVFPICIYESKMGLLVNTYMKALRFEKKLLLVNIYSLSLSVILTVILSLLGVELDYFVLLIVLVLAFRCIIAELILSRFLCIKLWREIIIESIIVVIFILVSWFLEPWMAGFCYLLIYIIYLFLQRESLSILLVRFKNVIQNGKI